MADELFRVRRNFLNKVRRPVLTQIMNGLLEDAVLSDPEMNAILEENPSTADKAGKLIDTVRLKGNKASKKMIDHIQKEDPFLYDELFT